jgi:hypothetical protein
MREAARSGGAWTPWRRRGPGRGASGSDGDYSDGGEDTALHLAAEAGHDHVVGSLLADPGRADVDAYTPCRHGGARDGRTALQLAAAAGRAGAVRALWRAGPTRMRLDGSGRALWRCTWRRRAGTRR